MKSKPLSNIRWGLLCFIAIIICSCKEFIEPSLSKRQINLQVPTDLYQSTKYNINFWWDEMDDALGYRLQVVTPNFGSPGSLIADTLVAGNKFSLNLDPGEYQWRVRAENGSSQSGYSLPRSFIVLQSTIKTQAVQLTSPGNNAVTNQGANVFQWGSLFGATKYQFEIDTNNFINENALVYNQTVPGQQISFTLPKDQTYQWRVRAQNDTADARWSGIYQITLDRTPPGKVSLTSPTNGQTVVTPVPLQWQAASTAVKYKLYVLKSDSTSVYNQNFPVILNTNSYSFNLGLPGDKVYWKVSAIDQAGNEGEASVMRSFVLQ
ncbi:hypothetical protein [Mucilaginibacter sp.]|uniref:hypothetical protein n=1 Tax=Mucilaginibacter sp. TaxID=1882438 RepID=UPI0032638489